MISIHILGVPLCPGCRSHPHHRLGRKRITGAAGPSRTDPDRGHWLEDHRDM